MAQKYFPLRWESTGDHQWWFASPIDCAAANGHYDLVRELLQIDNNLIFKLTSLPRIRRLETVWDDDDDKFRDVAKCRSKVARNLLRECETLKGHNSLIRAGYGGWLLYTAASAGDLVFVKELLDRDPLLVFGEGEYGVTDIFYAAARSRNWEVFRAVFDCSVSVKGRRKEVSPDFRWEMMNRAVHAAARGGGAVILGELLGDGCDDVLGYRDNQGSTVLHTAAGRGRVEVVKNLISSYDDIIGSVDNRGNTALNVAAYRGHLAVVEPVGFIFNGQDRISRNSIVSDLRLHGIENSPGTSFRIPDAEIVLHLGIEDITPRSSCTEYGYSGEIEVTSSISESNSSSSKYKKSGSMKSTHRRLKNFLRWLGKKERNTDVLDSEEDNLSFRSYRTCSSLQNSPVSLRQQFSRMSSLPNNKRILSLQGNIPTKKKFATHNNVRQVLPKSNLGSPSSAFSESSWSSPVSADQRKSTNLDSVSSNQSPNLENFKMKRKHGSFNLRLMNNYLCFGAQGIAVENSINSQSHCQNQQSLVV
ncbi:hypothetical protein DH2020_049684 [Rehmannia glutinosa]|uniref:Ankyrin repeat-containing protein n=1 Tax=Rehmannia glutinosa TaxID=99300 RepID=A0ABR0U249_REHGL